MDIKAILKDYDLSKLSIGVLGGHSALDVCSGAKEFGFNIKCYFFVCNWMFPMSLVFVMLYSVFVCLLNKNNIFIVFQLFQKY